MNIRDRNLRTAAAASAVSAGLILLIAVLSANPVSDAVQRRPSTFFTDPTGARAVYLVLDELLPSVEQWRRPLTDLDMPSSPERQTLIAMGPSTPLSPAEATALDTWIASGGQLILAADAGWPIERPSRDSDADRAPEDYLARHGFDPIAPAEGAAAATARSAVRTVGAGQLVYVPGGHAFSNASLGTSDNAVWLIQRSAAWGETVLLDEYHHGFGRKRGFLVLIAAFLISPWGLTCLQVALAGGIYILGTKRRFGRPVDELPVERTRPTERVEALGSLFEAARARGLSARAIQQYLNVYLSGLLGYRVDLSTEGARERLAGRQNLEQADLEAFAEGIEALGTARRSSDEALVTVARRATSIVRSLSHGADRGRAVAG